MIKPKPLICGISGVILTQQEKEFFKTNPVAGFILFKRNIISKEQVLSLTTELRNLNPEYEILIFIDQEGGRVARLRPPIAEITYPAAEYFGKLYEYNKELALSAVYANYTMLMGELKTLGIDSPCAPVVDLRYPYTDNIIGDRSFGNNIEQIVHLASAAIAAINDAGGIAIIKHLPGHGRAICDSHQELPIVTTKLSELNNTDFAVFRQLAQHAEWAMTAHIIFQALDPELPVTLSKKSINFIRNEIGFKGVLVSDDICMFALHANIGINNNFSHANLENLEDSNIVLHQKFIDNLILVTKQSLEAGCDFVLHGSGNFKEVIAIYDIM